MNFSNNEFKLGILSGFISSFVCNPLDVLRVNKQINKKINLYNLSTINKIKVLYKGINITLITIPCFWSIYFPSYKYFKENNYNFISGYLASNIASTITCPLWFIKQKVQTEKLKFNVYNYYKINGIKPFYNALITTYIINGSFIFQIPIYEYLKEKYIHDKSENKILKTFINTSLSKTFATCITYPIDTIRAIKRETVNVTIINIIKHLNKNPIKYYHGFNYYLMRSIPYHCGIFCTYEYLSKII